MKNIDYDEIKKHIENLEKILKIDPDHAYANAAIFNLRKQYKRRPSKAEEYHVEIEPSGDFLDGEMTYFLSK